MRFHLTAMALALAATGAMAQEESTPPADAASPSPVEPAAEAPAAEAPTPEEVATVPVDGPATEAAPTGTAPVAGRNRLVEEIVVTAQKREENIQDVPIAIAAFSPEKLDAIGVETAEDLERATPGLTITNAAGYNVAYLRGVGTDAFLAGADPSVPFYLDGVALLGTQGSSDTLGRIERVEVLKGPQGTLFGRNATGGAISIITPEPDSTFAGDVKVSYGNYNNKNVVAYANLPLVDRVALSASGFYDRYQNYFVNDTGPDIHPFARGFRFKLRLEPFDDWSITPSYSYNQAATNAGLAFENTRVAPIFCPANICATNPEIAPIAQDPKADRHMSFDQLSGAEIVNRLKAVTSVLKTSLVDLKLIMSDQKLDAPFVQSDFDKSPKPLVSFTSIRQISKQKTAELQLISNKETPFGDTFQWIGGFYYIKSSGGFDPLQFTVAPNFLDTLLVQNGGASLAQLLDQTILANLPALGGVIGSVTNGLKLLSYGVSEAKSWSAYFQGTYNFTDSFNLTLGARYQKEDRDLGDGHLTAVTPGGEVVIRDDGAIDSANQPPTLKATQVSPRVNFQWRPTDEGQVYLSWSRAYKSPTYNTVNFFDTPEAVKEEKVDTYELGFKYDLFGNNLRLDGATFFTKQKDLLTGFVALASGGVVEYANAGDAEIKGAEFDALWTPLPDFDPGLAITAAATYLDTEYTDYKDGRGFDEDTGLAFGEGSLTQLPGRDFTGNRIVRTPKWTYSFGVNQRWEFGPGGIEIGADTYYNSGFYFLPQNSSLYKRGSYQLYNARISVFHTASGAQITAFCQNLTDEKYNEVVFVDDLGRNQMLNAPRTYGVRVSVSF